MSISTLCLSRAFFEVLLPQVCICLLSVAKQSVYVGVLRFQGNHSLKFKKKHPFVIAIDVSFYQWYVLQFD